MTSLHGELECLVRSGRILLNGDAVRTPKKLKSRCSVWRGMLMMVTEDNTLPPQPRPTAKDPLPSDLITVIEHDVCFILGVRINCYHDTVTLVATRGYAR